MNAAAYARYSTDRQTNNSLEYQLAEIRKYCAAHEIKIVATFTDEAESGTNTERAGFQAMIAAARAGAFDAVVIYDITRGSRDVGDWFAFRKEMLRLNIRVISATQTLGELTNANDFLLELLSVGLGQREVLETRQKSINGVAVKAKQGVFLGGKPPLGYDIDENGRYIINPVEAHLVRVIFDLYAQGKSYNDILNNLHGAKGKRGRPIGKNSLYSILTNERYIGTYTWNKRQVKLFRKWAGGKPNPNCVRLENMIPPIVDGGTWERVARRMSDNKRNAKNKAKRNYLLSGLITCEACGAAYVGHTTTSGKGIETRYYVCGNKYRTHTCTAKNIRADEVEKYVVDGLKDYFASIDIDTEAARIAEIINSASPELKEERAELADIDAQLANGTRAVLKGADFEELHDAMDALRVRKSELEDIIAARSAAKREVSPAEIVQIFHEAIDGMDTDLPAVLRQHIKIYAHIDGSYSVNVGVHTNGCGGRT